MTTNAVALILLGHFSPEERTIPDATIYPGRNAAVLEAMNGGLQECYGQGSPWMRQDERGVVLKAPTAVTIAVSNGSTSATITGWASWMAGCSIIIAGHDIDNQIRSDAAACTLKYPYDGTTGTVAATVYHDCVTLGSDVLNVTGIVRADRRELQPTANPLSGLTGVPSNDYGGTGDFARTYHTPSPRIATAAGNVLAYTVDTWSPSDILTPVLRLRLQPAPSAAATLDYQVSLKPPVITDLASTAVLPIPLGFDQTIFLPIARQKLTASPYFRDTSGMQEINRAYSLAIELLESLNPRQRSGVNLRTRF